MIEYTGYWLYNEELEKFHPKQGRLAREGNRKVITEEEWKSVLQRAKSREEANTTKASEVSTTPGPIKNPQ